jgi:AraC-like DNA-binding protein
MDRLAALLKHFEIKTEVFGHGTLCGESVFKLEPAKGHIHIIKKAPLEIIITGGATLQVKTPSLVFFAQPTEHKFKASESEGADMVCATVSIGSGLNSPLVMGFPQCLIIPLDQLRELDNLLSLLYYEAHEQRCGKKEALNYLMDYLILRMYRYAIQEDLVANSAIAGLSDAKINKAVHLMHEKPGFAWSLEALAEAAGMSRARFAEYFKKKVGVSPIQYLIDLRISLSLKKMRNHQSIKSIAHDLGYNSASAFARAFHQKLNLSPSDWMKNHLSV